MYLLFCYHDIMPHEYMEMGWGERKVVSAFMHYQIEKKNAEIEKLSKL